jgi:hypothetical protein
MRSPRTLTEADLERHSIWEEVGSEGGAYDGRLRPRPDLSVAADPESETGSFFVAAEFTLADGRRFNGYCAPVPVAVRDLRGWFGGIGLLQPAIVTGRGQVRFWFAEEPSPPALRASYELLGGGPERVFPVAFEARIEVPRDHFASGRLDGFCFPRRSRFLTPFPMLNRTFLAARLGHVR